MELAVEIFILLCAGAVLVFSFLFLFGDYLKRKFRRSAPLADARRERSGRQTADSYSVGPLSAEHVNLSEMTGSGFTSSLEVGADFGGSDSTAASGEGCGESGGSDSGGFSGGGDFGGGGSGGGWN